jgi:hypothetical protein
MLTKPLYTSKTIIGIIVLALSWAAERWGLPVTEGDLTEAATLILGAVGAVLAVYGRLSATKPISSSGSGNHLPALLLAVSVAVLTSGCALRDLSAQDKALAVGEELRLVYLEMHNAYLAVEPTCSRRQGPGAAVHRGPGHGQGPARYRYDAGPSRDLGRGRGAACGLDQGQGGRPAGPGRCLAPAQ